MSAVYRLETELISNEAMPQLKYNYTDKYLKKYQLLYRCRRAILKHFNANVFHTLVLTKSVYDALGKLPWVLK